MPLTAGDKLGPYEILSAIGAGGMGEVYKARDARLDRSVAIKVLPEHIAQREDSRARFEREARSVASLNHPHICVVHDTGPNYMVMEMIEGETLAARIEKGPIPIDQALKFATQIADALDRAHRAGVTHRDIKPQNIMLTRDGVKVLDFGLAKSAASKPGPAEATLTNVLTTEGSVIGTPQYMAPEQFEGKEADARCDIWAFGAVLYEMVTGRKAFLGKNYTSLVAAILGGEPAPMAVQPFTPAWLERMVLRCLAKDPEDRWQSMRDVVLELSMPPLASAAAPSKTSRWLGVAAGGFALAFLVAAAGWYIARRPTAAAATTRMTITVPANRPVAITGSPTRALAISPDGTQLVYVGANPDVPDPYLGGRPQLQLRSLASLEVRDLPGTMGARQPFFSPDGQWVAFFTSSGELRKTSLAGGSPITLAERIDGSSWAFGVWTEDNTIVFGTSGGGGLRQVPAEGGAVTSFTTPDAAQGEVGHSFPALVPSGRAVLFSKWRRGGGAIEAVMLDSGKRSVVLENASFPLVLSSGHLVFVRDGSLLVAAFDSSRLTVTGSAVPLLDKVRQDGPLFPTPELAVSRSGTLAYLPAADTTSALGLVGRDGTFQPLGLPRGDYHQPRVSPDGRSVAYIVSEGRNRAVHVYDLQRGTTTKLTPQAVDAVAGWDVGIAWHPDGRSLGIHSARLKGASGIFLRNLDGREQLVVKAAAFSTRNFSWAPDGKQLAYTVQNGSLHDIWVQTMGEKPPTQPFLNSAASEYSPAFSPDGRWMAYNSDESGRPEVYVRGYPQGERLAVSTGGGNGPAWRRDGKELYFQGQVDGALKMMAVAVTADGASLRLAKPVPLFDLQAKGPTGVIEQYARSGNDGRGYDVLPDGRFLMIRGADRGSIREIVVVQNWFEELKRLGTGK